MRKVLKSQAGYTLVEAMTCCVIISVVSTIALPSLLSWTGRLSFGTDVNCLVRNIHKAKFEAIKTNSYVVMKFFDDGYEIFVDNGEGSSIKGDWIRQPLEKQLASYHFHGKVDFLNNFTLNRTRFTGRPGVKAGTIVLSDKKGNTIKVIVNAIGRVRQVKM